MVRCRWKQISREEVGRDQIVKGVQKQDTKSDEHNEDESNFGLDERYNDKEEIKQGKRGKD